MEWVNERGGGLTMMGLRVKIGHQLREIELQRNPKREGVWNWIDVRTGNGIVVGSKDTGV